MISAFPIITCAGALVAAAIAVAPAPVAAALEFQRDAVAAGAWWRLATCHFTHFGANHVVWDVAMWCLLGAVCERRSRSSTGLALALAAFLIPTAVWLWQPHFAIYRGLSGLDSALFGLFVGGLLRHARFPARLLGVVGTLGFLGKCGVEVMTANTLFAEARNYAPVPLAHALGGICGALVGAFRSATCRSSTCSTTPPPCPSDRSSPTPAPSAGH